MFISNLQILRGFAAIWVVIFHATYSIKAYSGAPSAIINFLGGKGYFGVDIFFIISGFVIYSAANKKIELGGLNFFRGRCERILPPYIFLTIIYVFLKTILPDFFLEKEPLTLLHFISSIFYVSFVNFHRPEMVVGWTLEFEMLFYALVTIVISMRKQIFNHVPMLISILVIAGYVHSLYFVQNNIISFVSNPLIIEFALGFVIAQYLLKGVINKTAIPFLFCALAVIFISNRPIVVGIVGSAALVFIAVAMNKKTRMPLPLKHFLEELGNASYMIYLIQIFTLPLAGQLMASSFASENPTLLGLFTIVLTVACGWLAHAFAEIKVLALIRRPEIMVNAGRLAKIKL